MATLLNNMKKIFLFFILLTSILVSTSCSKDSLMVCGNVTGGRTEFNEIAQQYYFYLNLDGRPQRVDQKTYESYYVGDYICLE